MPNNFPTYLGNMRDRQCFRLSQSLNNKLLCMISMRRIQKCLLCYSVYVRHIASAFIAYLDIQSSTSWKD